MLNINHNKKIINVVPWIFTPKGTKLIKQIFTSGKTKPWNCKMVTPTLTNGFNSTNIYPWDFILNNDLEIKLYKYYLPLRRHHPQSCQCPFPAPSAPPVAPWPKKLNIFLSKTKENYHELGNVVRQHLVHPVQKLHVQSSELCEIHRSLQTISTLSALHASKEYGTIPTLC